MLDVHLPEAKIVEAIIMAISEVKYMAGYLSSKYSVKVQSPWQCKKKFEVPNC